MHSRFRIGAPFAIAAIVAIAALGCGDDGAAEPADAGADLQESAAPGIAEAIRFDPDSTLTLAPGELHALQVVVEPPGEHRVRFSLLGDSLDASLEADLQVTDADGRTGTNLTAPQSATTFRVRAVADDGPSAEIAVSVSGSGFASIRVVPQYVGTRTTFSWIVSAAALTTCAQKKGLPPADGPLWTSGDDGSPITLHGVPAGTPIAVTARSGVAVGGCTDVPKLVAGAEESVTVSVADAPIRLENTKTTIAMVLEGTTIEPWLQSSTEDFVAAFTDGKVEASALLDEIGGRLPEPDEFAQARKAGGWDLKTAEYLAAKGKKLTSHLEGWLAKGTLPLRAGSFLGGKLEGSASTPSHPKLVVESFGGLAAEDAVPILESALTLSADPGDTIHIGGSVFVLPSRYLAKAADSAATKATGADAVTSLRTAVSCQELAEEITSWGNGLATCDAQCLAPACEEAVARMWRRARDWSATTFSVAGWTFTAAADAVVDSEASIASFEGTWAGELSEGSEVTSVKGTVVGSGER